VLTAETQPNSVVDSNKRETNSTGLKSFMNLPAALKLYQLDGKDLREVEYLLLLSGRQGLV
jgi:hypothetical protein